MQQVRRLLYGNQRRTGIEVCYAFTLLFPSSPPLPLPILPNNLVFFIILIPSLVLLPVFLQSQPGFNLSLPAAEDLDSQLYEGEREARGRREGGEREARGRREGGEREARGRREGGEREARGRREGGKIIFSQSFSAAKAVFRLWWTYSHKGMYRATVYLFILFRPSFLSALSLSLLPSCASPLQ